MKSLKNALVVIKVGNITRRGALSTLSLSCDLLVLI